MRLLALKRFCGVTSCPLAHLGGLVFTANNHELLNYSNGIFGMEATLLSRPSTQGEPSAWSQCDTMLPTRAEFDYLFSPGILLARVSVQPFSSLTMGQLFACFGRRQVEKFEDEDPKLRSVGPPVRETIYVAYVLCSSCHPRRAGVLINWHQGHGIHWEWKNDGVSLS